MESQATGVITLIVTASRDTIASIVNGNTGKFVSSIGLIPSSSG